LNPFDFVNDLSQAKKDLIRSSDDREAAAKAYSPFMVNRAFSYYPDTVLHANEMNRASGIDNLLQHDYYKAAVRSKKRFSKWHKAEADATAALVAEAYGININRAREYLSLMSREDIEAVKNITNKGGLK
jgi:hypothetical protein